MKPIVQYKQRSCFEPMDEELCLATGPGLFHTPGLIMPNVTKVVATPAVMTTGTATATLATPRVSVETPPVKVGGTTVKKTSATSEAPQVLKQVPVDPEPVSPPEARDEYDDTDAGVTGNGSVLGGGGGSTPEPDADDKNAQAQDPDILNLFGWKVRKDNAMLALRAITLVVCLVSLVVAIKNFRKQ